MTKAFCDVCGHEINDENRCCGGNVYPGAGRLGIEIPVRTLQSGKQPRSRLSHSVPYAKFKVEIMHSFDGTANEGHVCKYCVIDAINRLDDRPRAA